MDYRELIDFSFINLIVEYLDHPHGDIIEQITSSETAKSVHGHAYRFHNTKLNCRDFWAKSTIREVDGHDGSIDLSVSQFVDLSSPT